MKKAMREFLQHGDISKISTYRAGILQASMNRRLQKLSDEILKPFGISKTQWLIIGAVLDEEPRGARVTDLAVLLGTTAAFITHHLAALELRNMLIRSVHDRDNRTRLLRIHPTFLSTCAEIEATLRDGLRTSIYANVDPQDFRTYIKVLYQLSE